jgi:exodeoxyribonuclease-3
VTTGIGIEHHDKEGRVVTLEFDNFYMVDVYTPNAQQELARLDYRMQWESDFMAYLCALDAKKPVIVCGDMNVAHNEIDLKNPATNHKNPGFSDEERSAFSRLLDAGFVDTFRTLHPDEQIFSWWSYRFSARQKNIGWRIDYFLVSKRLLPQVTDASIHTDILGSDHCPVSLTIN